MSCRERGCLRGDCTGSQTLPFLRPPCDKHARHSAFYPSLPGIPRVFKADSVSNKSLLTRTKEQPVKSHECDFCRNHCLWCSPSMDVFHLQRRGTWKLHIFLQSKPLSRLVGDPSHHCSHFMPGNIQEQSTRPIWQLLAEERTAFGSQRG